MEEISKNILKAICYALLFLGIQCFVSYAVRNVLQKQELFLMDVNWVSVASCAITVLVLWLFFRIRKKSFFEEAGIYRFGMKNVLPLIILGIALSFFVNCVLNILPIPEDMLESYIASSRSLIEGSLLSRILGIVIMAPLVEEIIFRGLVLSRLKSAINPTVAIIISSLLFGVLHGQLLWTVYATLIGIMLAVVAEKIKSVGASIIVHMAFNSVSVFAMQFNPIGHVAYIAGIIFFVTIFACCYYIFNVGTNG